MVYYSTAARIPPAGAYNGEDAKVREQLIAKGLLGVCVRVCVWLG